jgi:hypothetical protein
MSRTAKSRPDANANNRKDFHVLDDLEVNEELF